MSEKNFKSSLPMEEIENNFKDTNFFDGVMEGLEEALAYEKGTAKTETIARKRSLPDVNVSQIRNALSMTQKAFANVLVSKTLGVIYETRIFIRQATRWRNRHKQINDTSCHK